MLTGSHTHQSINFYANAEKVVLTHAPALKRAQRGDVVAAIAAKDAQAAATAAQGANAAHLRDNALKRSTPKRRNAQSFVEIFLIQMGRSSSTARDANRTTPTRDGQIIAESTTPQFRTVPANIPK